jgi:hypothetical protein
MIEDDSVFLYGALIRRRMWTPEGKRPIVVTTGSHQKTCIWYDYLRWKTIIQTIRYL